MMYSAPTITKEQYENLAKLSDKKEPNLSIDSKQHGLGDKLSSFLKEHIGEVNLNNTSSDVNFYKLVERVA